MLDWKKLDIGIQYYYYHLFVDFLNKLKKIIQIGHYKLKHCIGHFPQYNTPHTLRGTWPALIFSLKKFDKNK